MKAYNYLRILIATLYVFVMISEIYNSFVDKETYERVYVGEYFYSIYANLSIFRLLSLMFISLAIIYIYLVSLHLKKMNNNKLSVCLIIIDVVFIVSYTCIHCNSWY